MLLLPLADCVLHVRHAMVIFTFFRYEVSVYAMPSLTKFRYKLSSQDELLLEVGLVVSNFTVKSVAAEDHFAASEKEAFECIQNVISTWNYDLVPEEVTEHDSPEELLGLIS